MDPEEYEEECIYLFQRLKWRIKSPGVPWCLHGSGDDLLASAELLLEHQIMPKGTICPRCGWSIVMRSNLKEYRCNRCSISMSWREGSIFKGRTGIKLHQMIGILGVTLLLKDIVDMQEIVDEFGVNDNVVSWTMEQYSQVLLWHAEQVEDLPEEYRSEGSIGAYEYFLHTVEPKDRLAEFFKILRDYHREVMGYDPRRGSRIPQKRSHGMVHGNSPSPPPMQNRSTPIGSAPRVSRTTIILWHDMF